MNAHQTSCSACTKAACLVAWPWSMAQGQRMASPPAHCDGTHGYPQVPHRDKRTVPLGAAVLCLSIIWASGHNSHRHIYIERETLLIERLKMGRKSCISFQTLPGHSDLVYPVSRVPSQPLGQAGSGWGGEGVPSRYQKREREREVCWIWDFSGPEQVSIHKSSPLSCILNRCTGAF